MPVYSPRRRLVNFRVNDEEYAALRAACLQDGARSISDFARVAVLRQAGAGERQATSMQWRLSVLGHKMSELECRIVQLLRRLEISSLEPEQSPAEGAGGGR